MSSVTSYRKKSARQTARVKSIQRSFVDLRAVHNQVLCLATQTPGAYDYAGVLEVQGISYDLKSEEEQCLINDLYQACLSGLSFPIQILWRALPLNLAPYLAQFSGEAPRLPSPDPEKQQETSDEIHGGIWMQLASAHVAFVKQMAAQHMLLERTIYLIVRSSGLPTEQRSLLQHMFLPKRKRAQAEVFTRASQILDVRINELTRLLATMNLSVRRLSDTGELASFYYSCLTPTKAARFPLPEAIIARLEHPVQASPPSEKRLAEGLSWEYILARAVLEAESQTSTPSKKSRQRQRQEKGEIGRASLLAHVADLVAPAALTISPNVLQVEEEYCRTIVVRNLPRVVSAGWLKPLTELDEPLEMSFHLVPYNSALMVQQFRRRHMEYQSSRLLAQQKGMQLDPDLKVASADVEQLLERLASGEERMLDVSMHLLLRGASIQELDQRTERIMSILHHMLLVAHSAFFEQEKAFRSCLPHAKNLLGEGILLDSRSASTMFPFLSQTLFHADGIFEGMTPSGDLVVLDPWGARVANANRMILGPPGWGKSHQVKASMIRMALKYTLRQRQHRSGLPFQIIVIDPEREYGRTAAALQGHIFRLAPGSQHHINPFDLPRAAMDDEELGTGHGDLLADHVQTLHTLLDIMLADRTPDGTGTLTSQEKGLLDRALYETYRKVGITSESRTQYHPAPLMRDLYEVLERGVCGPDPTGLTARLRRYVYGSLAGLFTGPTDVELDNVVVVFDIHDMETELRPIGLFLVSNFVWTRSFQSLVPRQLIVDEAATLYHFESGAVFLEDLVRRARKHYLGVTVISQHPIMFQQSALPSNCATHILMRQDATSLDLIERMFKLSSREVQLLRRLGVGEALLITGDTRLHVRFETSALEHLLATTDPREVAGWYDDSAYEQIRAFLQTLDPSFLHLPEGGRLTPTIKGLPKEETATQRSEEPPWRFFLGTL